MADQLSLFPEKDLPTGQTPVFQGEIGALDEMFLAGTQFRERTRFVDMLRFLARFPGYSPLNGFLLYLQKPEATVLATAGGWQRRFGREIRPHAHPAVILAPMAPVRFLFDVADTLGAGRAPERVPVCRPSDRGVEELVARIVGNCPLHGIAVRSVPAGDPRAGQTAALTYDTRKRYRDLSPEPEAGAGYLIVVDGGGGPAARFDGLCRGLGHVFCGHMGIDSTAWWQDRRGVDAGTADVEADAVAALVLGRKGFLERSEARLAACVRQGESLLPVLSLNSVLISTQYVEEMGKERWQAPRKKSRYL